PVGRAVRAAVAEADLAVAAVVVHVAVARDAGGAGAGADADAPRAALAVGGAGSAHVAGVADLSARRALGVVVAGPHHAAVRDADVAAAVRGHARGVHVVAAHALRAGATDLARPAVAVVAAAAGDTRAVLTEVIRAERG